MLRRVIIYFDKLEDKVRMRLAHYPIIYALIGGVGIVLFWKGVWETAEYFPSLFGPASVILGILILLVTGLLVSFFIGDTIIISGFKGEKKLVEKTEEEVKSEKETMEQVVEELKVIEADIEQLKRGKRTALYRRED